MEGPKGGEIHRDSFPNLYNLNVNKNSRYYRDWTTSEGFSIQRWEIFSESLLRGAVKK